MNFEMNNIPKRYDSIRKFKWQIHFKMKYTFISGKLYLDRKTRPIRNEIYLYKM